MGGYRVHYHVLFTLTLSLAIHSFLFFSFSLDYRYLEANNDNLNSKFCSRPWDRWSDIGVNNAIVKLGSSSLPEYQMTEVSEFKKESQNSKQKGADTFIQSPPPPPQKKIFRLWKLDSSSF